MNAQLKYSALVALLLASCGEESRVAGNGTYIGNGQTSGVVVMPSGSPAEGAWIECTPSALAPWDGREPGWTSIADSRGRFICTDLPDGAVGVRAYDALSGLERWWQDSVDASAPGDPRIDTLLETGDLRIAVTPGTTGLLYFTGLSRSISLRGQSEILATGMPAGWNGAIKLSESISNSITLDSGLLIQSNTIDSIGFTRQSSTLRIPLDGGLTQAMLQVPVLLRLDSTWKGFAASLPDGSDLRLSTPGGASLPLTIASWDPQSRTGALWTTLDTLQAPGDSIDVVLSWGIPVPASSALAAFDAARGWLGAWPLGDTTASFLDRLGANFGTPTLVTALPGPIARASHFDGSASILRMQNSTASSIVTAQGTAFTMSCWARLDRFPTDIGQAAGSGEFGSRMYFKPIQTFDSIQDTNVWVARDHRSTPKSGGPYHVAKANASSWTHLALAVEGDSVRFFVDGIRQMRITKFDSYPTPRTPADFAIGGAIDSLGQPKWYFPGDIAEVWMQSIARSPDWIRLTSRNQRPDAPKARPLD